MAVHILPQRSIAFLGNYLPRKCGIATFTTDLKESIASEAGSERDTFVIAMTNTPEGYEYPLCVRFEIRQNQLQDYEQAADFINNSKVDVLCIQHEYGIFGGKWGGYLLNFMRKVRVPIVTTLHTVLSDDRGQKDVLKELIALSDKVVVMSAFALRLIEKNGCSDKKIVLIPHGIPDLPFVDSNQYKAQFNAEGRRVILTFGLLNPDKGIEFMIDALPAVVKKHPDIVYIVLGATHPEILKHHGEKYRFELIRHCESLGLENYVHFHNRFVKIDELCEYLSATDIYVSPYLTREQIISGTLSYAVGAGKAVVSTPSWCAEELLTDGRGALVPFRDSKALAAQILRFLDSEEELQAVKKKAYQFGRSMIWREVARQYLKLFEQVQTARPIVIDREWEEKVATISALEFPVPKLDHTKVLTDDYAIIQHAQFTIPDYSHGYALDDNARALVAVSKHYRMFEDLDSLRLLRKYLAFVLYAQNDDGSFVNFYSIERKPLEKIGSSDSQGRALWGLGYVIAYAPDYFWMVAKTGFDKAVPRIKGLSLRSAAFAMMGLYYYLCRYPGALNIRAGMKVLANGLVDQYKKCSTKKWIWFEKKLTYSNGLLPTALWLAYEALKEDVYGEIAEITTSFVMDICRKKGRVSLVGCKGWMEKSDVKKADFDQQPVDAMWLVKMAQTAYTIKRDQKYLTFMRLAFDWFLGVNDMGVPLYDYVTGGCYDGLTPSGPNLNQGTESTLSCLLALLDITEMSSNRSEVFLRKARLENR